MKQAEAKLLMQLSRVLGSCDRGDVVAYLANYYSKVEALIKNPGGLENQQNIQALHFRMRDFLRNAGMKI